MDQPQTMPVIYISHGGGPCFWITFPPPFDPETFPRLAAYLGGILDGLPARPTAILLVTAHWETSAPSFVTSERPGMLYDYYGFPKHTYELQFPAPGAPGIAKRARELLAAAGIASDADQQRGFDHGVFVPMLKITPDADIPVLSMSICQDMDPARHIAIGKALAPLRDEGVLIIGSGLSFHNMDRRNPPPLSNVFAWNDWLVDTVTAPDPVTRNDGLAGWVVAPHAREAHPHEDHLIPLMVTAGAASGDVGRLVYADKMGPNPVSGFQFG